MENIFFDDDQGLSGDEDLFDDEDTPEPNQAPASFLTTGRGPAINPWRYIGRNDSCPCGSGKKAKRCCLKA